MKNNTLYLVDISSFIFRAFYAIRALSNRSGEPTNAVYGVASMLAKLIEKENPEYISIIYDSKEKSFRKEMYEEYKANRQAPPDELIPQFARIEDLIKRMGFCSLRQSGVEADDLIGSLTKHWIEEDPSHKVVIVTGDKDLMQLVNERVTVLDTMKEMSYKINEVIEKFGIRPNQVRDYLSLVGDSSDNIPGVPSIGPKGAVDLLMEFHTLEGVIEAAKKGLIKGRKGATLVENEQLAWLSQKLTSLKMDCPIPHSVEEMRSPFFEAGHVTANEETLQLLRELELNSIATKWAMRNQSPDYMQGLAQSKPNSSMSTSSMGQSTGVQSSYLSHSGNLSNSSELTNSSFQSQALNFSSAHFITVDTQSVLNDLCALIEKHKEFVIDLETTSLNPREAILVGIAIAVRANEAFYIPLGHLPTLENPEPKQLKSHEVLDQFRKYLENPQYKKMGHNLKYDFSVLHYQGIQASGIGADTMIADYVLNPDQRHGLDHVISREFNYKMLSFEEVCGTGKNQITFDQVAIPLATRYSAEDAWTCYHLWQTLKPRLNEQGLMRVFAEVDLPLVSVLTEMECNGVKIDEPWFKELQKDFSQELQKIDEEIHKHSKNPINLNSPKQLQELLFAELKLPVQTKTKTGYSTDVSVLEALAPLHVVPRMILEHRELQKLLSTYIEPLPRQKDQKTNRIHASFNQAVTATGRLSSQDPNLQNIPVRSERGQKIRRGFIAEKGCVLLSADYSQIELRLLAQMSGDPDLVASFNRGEDVHRRTASEIYSVPTDQVTDEQRSVAKAINFGLMYGKTAFGLAQELNISRTMAKEMIDRYFLRYYGVKTFLDSLIENAKEKGYVETLIGRKRILTDINAKNPMMRANAERMAMNTPIQGTAADLMKLAMIKVADDLKTAKLRSKMTIQVHDEIVLEVLNEELEQVKSLVTHALEHAFDGVVKLIVPLKANIAIGENWMDL